MQACFTSKHLNKTANTDSLYVIKSIDSVNNWYVILAVKRDSSYKIVVKKEKEHDAKCEKPIVVGQSYHLELHSRKNEAPVINGIKIKPVNYLDIQCYTYDENTVICIEPQKGIYDLFHTSNIKGLCYISSDKQ